MLNDYKGLKLIASSNPHIRNNEDTRSIMLDVIIALCPALIMSVIRFGFRALISVLVSVVSAMFFEWLYRKLLHKTQTLGDLSAAVTGMLLAFVSPVTLPYWMLIVGNFFAIFVVKQLYGGLGKNFLNPALAGRAALVACYTGQMTSWIDPSTKAALFGGADVVTAATPLAMMKGGEFAEVTAQYSLRLRSDEKHSSARSPPSRASFIYSGRRSIMPMSAHSSFTLPGAFAKSGSTLSPMPEVILTTSECCSFLRFALARRIMPATSLLTPEISTDKSDATR